MANIVWSFGIALQAQDETGEAIDAVIGRVRNLNQALGRMDEASQTSVDALNSLNVAETRLADSIDSTGQSVDHTTKLFGTFEHTVAKAVETTISGIASLAKGVFNAPMILARGLTQTLMDIPNIVSRWVFDTDLNGLISGLSNAYNATEKFLDLANDFAPFDQALRQLTAQTGGTEEAAVKLIEKTIDMGAKFGYSAGEVATLAVALGDVGSSVDELGDDKVRTLSNLAYTFGLGASESVRFSTAAKRMGADLNNLAGQAAVFGKAFGIPNIMQTLPEVANVAAESISTFGRTVAGNAADIVTNTLKSSAVLAKALGKDIREAAGLAIQSFQKFSNEIKSNRKLMVGLADDITPLQMALLEGGAGWQGMMDILREGQKDPLAAADSIRTMMQSMNPVMLERFTIQMQDQLPEAIRKLVFEENAHTAALEERARAQDEANRAAKAGIPDVTALTEGMRSNFTSARKVFDDVSSSVGTLIESVFLGMMAPALKDITTKVTEFSDGLKLTINEMRKTGEFKKIQEVFKTVAGFLVLAGRGAGFLAKSLLAVETVTGLLTPLSYGIELVQNLFDGLPGTALKSFALLSKSIYQGIGVFEFLENTIVEVKGVLAGTGNIFDKFGGITKAVLGNLADYTNSFFFGLPNKIVKAFTKGVDKDKATFRTAVMGIMDFAYGAIKDQLAQWNSDIPANLTQMWTNAGENIGTALGKITKTVVNFVRGLFSSEDRASVWEKLTNMFKGTEAEKGSITSSFLEISGKVLSAVKGFVTGFADGFLTQFGTNTTLIINDIKLSFKEFAASAAGTWLTIKEAFTTTYNIIAPLMKTLASGTLTIAEGLVKAAKVASDVRNYSDASRLEELKEKNATGGGLLSGALSQKELDELAKLEAKESARLASYKEKIDSIGAAQKAVADFKAKIEDQENKAQEEKLRKQDQELKQERMLLEYQKEKFKLLSSVAQGELNVGTAIQQALLKGRFELIPEIAKTATISRESTAPVEGKLKIEQTKVETKGVGGAIKTPAPNVAVVPLEAKPSEPPKTLPVSIETDKPDSVTSPVSAGQRVTATAATASVDVQMLATLQRILETLMEGLSPEKRMMLIKIMLDETAKKNGFDYHMSQLGSQGGTF